MSLAPSFVNLARIPNVILCIYAQIPIRSTSPHAHVIVTPVIEAGGFCVRVPGQALRNLNMATVGEAVRHLGYGLSSLKLCERGKFPKIGYLGGEIWIGKVIPNFLDWHVPRKY